MSRLLRKVRRRFGISAPRLTVRTQLAWYWRWLGLLVSAAMVLAVAAWMYDAGRRFAGFDRSELEQERNDLRAAVSRLEEELASVRAVANAGESRVKVEQSAQAQLAKQAQALEEENRRLKEDLAFFENLGPAGDRLSINRFTVQPDVLPGEYRYRLLVLGGGRRERPFQGSLQLVLKLQGAGQGSMIVLPGTASADADSFRLNFKYFQRVEGTFRVPGSGRLQSVQVRVLESGANQARATQSVDLS
jgi:DNA-binding protein YbaB